MPKSLEKIDSVQIDFCLRILNKKSPKGIIAKELVQAMFPNDETRESIWKDLTDKLDLELRIADYDIKTDILTITERGIKIYFEFGSYAEFIKNREKADIILQSQHESNNKIARLTTWIAFASIITAVYYLLEIMKFVYSFFHP